MSKFTILIREEPSGGFWGEVPSLPGCYSQGETVDELLANLREAISGVLEVMREEGRSPEANVQVLELAISVQTV
ncbi:MAG TPA: type II toxin-antitoxin system HicB family antitoxin, partial [Bryobacteraceae bacterium]|nr:type II toxin-antitoxin system HicB family antitoxin [Bryobacteraceae bacterium]